MKDYERLSTAVGVPRVISVLCEYKPSADSDDFDNRGLCQEGWCAVVPSVFLQTGERVHEMRCRIWP